MLPFKPETIETFKKIYSERKETVDFLEKYGNRFEKAQAMLIKEVLGVRNA